MHEQQKHQGVYCTQGPKICHSHMMTRKIKRDVSLYLNQLSDLSAQYIR